MQALATPMAILVHNLQQSVDTCNSNNVLASFEIRRQQQIPMRLIHFHVYRPSSIQGICAGW
jgi:hypothetical protein